NAAREQLSDGAELSGARRRDRLPIESNELLPAGRDRVRRRSRRDVALHEHVVVAEHWIPASMQAGRRERTLGSREESGIARRIDVRPVVERVRVRGCLDPLVTGAAAVGIDPTSAQDSQGLIELLSLFAL